MGDLQEHAQQLFATLLGLEPSEREACLDEIGRPSPSDRMRVEQLLRDDQKTGSVLNGRVLDPALLPTKPPPTSSQPGSDARVSAYVPQFRPGDVIANRFAV